jgi:hypothetical protein
VLADLAPEITVLGDELEQANFERQLLEFDFNTLSKGFFCPVQLSKVTVASVFADTHPPIGFNGSIKNHA